MSQKTVTYKAFSEILCPQYPFARLLVLFMSLAVFTVLLCALNFVFREFYIDRFISQTALAATAHKDEYIDIVIKQLEHLNPKIVIQRLTGDPMKEELITPIWTTKKIDVLNGIDKEMVKRNTYQGSKCFKFRYFTKISYQKTNFNQTSRKNFY